MNPGISPHFVCLSMIVNRRAWGDYSTLSAVDCLAWAIEHENDPVDPPPLVERAVAMFQRAAAAQRR